MAKVESREFVIEPTPGRTERYEVVTTPHCEIRSYNFISGVHLMARFSKQGLPSASFGIAIEDVDELVSALISAKEHFSRG